MFVTTTLCTLAMLSKKAVESKRRKKEKELQDKESGNKDSNVPSS